MDELGRSAPVRVSGGQSENFQPVGSSLEIESQLDADQGVVVVLVGVDDGVQSIDHAILGQTDIDFDHQVAGDGFGADFVPFGRSGAHEKVAESQVGDDSRGELDAVELEILDDEEAFRGEHKQIAHFPIEVESGDGPEVRKLEVVRGHGAALEIDTGVGFHCRNSAC